MIVGDRGTVLVSENDGPFELVPSGTDAALLAVAPDGNGCVAVGEGGTILHIQPDVRK